jgi:hypothetical protein
MKKILILISVVAFGFGCDKIAVKEPIAADGGTTAIKFSIQTPNSVYPKINYVPNGTTAQYLSLEDNDIKVKFEAPILAPNDIYLVYGINAPGIAKLNTEGLAKDPKYKPFFLLPDSTYQILVTKDTIRKGQQYAEKVAKNIVVNTTKIDPSVNYMLPLTVTSSAYPSAAGTGTIYYYIIGNPLAGKYNMGGGTPATGRYNCTVPGDQGWAFPSPVPANFALAAIPAQKSLIPLSDTLCFVDVANLSAGSGRDYYIGYDPNRSLTNVSFYLTQSFADGISNIRKFVSTYDPATKRITLVWTYNNQPGGAGSDRIVSETFTK